jgi:hypothetical protein
LSKNPRHYRFSRVGTARYSSVESRFPSEKGTLLERGTARMPSAGESFPERELMTEISLKSAAYISFSTA